MATLKQVLQYHPDYAGQGWHWRGDGDTYAGVDDNGKPLGLLVWGDLNLITQETIPDGVPNTIPVPTELELNSKRAAADAAWLIIRREELGRVLLTKQGDHLITALDILVDAVVELQTELKPAALNTPLTETNRTNTLRSRINELKTKIQNEA